MDLKKVLGGVALGAIALGALELAAKSSGSSKRKPSRPSSDADGVETPPKKEYYCRYCGKRFFSIAALTNPRDKCLRHPDGACKGPHAVYNGL